MGMSVETGRPGPWYEYTIDPDAVAAFAAATNDPNEACRTGEVVPPVYTAALILDALADGQGQVPEDAVEGGIAGVHAQHQMTFHRPIEVGTTVMVRGMLDYLGQAKPGAMNSVRLEVCDTEGRLCRRHDWVNINVGSRLLVDPVGDPVVDTPIGDEERSLPLGTYAVHVDRDQTFRYAGATGEKPPHSLSDTAARAEGFDRKILQGMCTFTIGVSGVLHHVGADLGKLRRLTARFSRPCHPDSELEVAMYDAGPAEGLARRIAWEAISGGETVIKNALVELDH
jgi:acyl dehydratase